MTPIPDDAPYRALVCAIIRQTVLDYRKQDARHEQAAQFLRSREAQEFFWGWGLDLKWIRERLEVGNG